MDAPAIALHENMIRLLKGIVSYRERHGAAAGVKSPIGGMLPPAVAGLLEMPLAELKAAVGMWDQWLKLERTKAPG